MREKGIATSMSTELCEVIITADDAEWTVSQIVH